MRRRDPNRLTDREREVLALLRRDFTNEQIAQRLGISVDGAKYHVSQILSKLGVATREEAAACRPERHPWLRKLAWIGVAGAVATALTGVVLAMSDRGTSVTVESGAFADESVTAVATSRPMDQTASHMPTQAAASPPPTAAPTVVLIGPILVDLSELPTPEPEPTPAPTETPGPSATATATPTPCKLTCSGIEGHVVQAPVCGPESDPPLPGCEPPPYQARIIVWNADRSEQVLQFTTDEQGQFRVPLSPGEYYIDPEGQGLPSPPDPFLVTVPLDRFVQLVIRYFTGIL
jgi:DNA-binding CsgD family transcriptional regulator